MNHNHSNSILIQVEQINNIFSKCILRFELEEIVETSCELFKDIKSPKASYRKTFMSEHSDFEITKDGTMIFGIYPKSKISNNLFMKLIPVISSLTV